MFKHVTIRLTILLILLLLMAISAPGALAQTASGKTTPNPIPQVTTVPVGSDMTPDIGQISHHFKIQPTPKKSKQVDLGNVIMEPRNPYKVYTDPRLELLWFRKDHPALALDFKPKSDERK